MYKKLSPEAQARLQARAEAHEARLAKTRAAKSDSYKTQRLKLLAVQVGPLHSQCTIKNFEAVTEDQQRIKDAMVAYAKDIQHNVTSGRGLVLTGSVGTGKDHLLCALAKWAIVNGCSCQWRSGPSLWAEFRDGMTEETTEKSTLKPLYECDVLILSDPLGVGQTLMDYRKEKLYQIVDERTRRMRPIWLSANILTHGAAERAFGTPTWDRLIGNAAWHILAWESYRRKAH